MRKNQEVILKFCLIFNLSICWIYANSDYDQDSTGAIEQEDAELVLNYPGKPLLMSLILPGSGQYYMKEPFWKPATFLGIELVSIISWISFSRRSDDVKNSYKSYANNNWTLEAVKGLVENAIIDLDLTLPEFAKPVRVLLTGSLSSPSIDKTIFLLGKKSCIQRIGVAKSFVT